MLAELEAEFGGGDDEFTGSCTSTSSGTNPVRYYDQEGNEIDPLSPEAENLKEEAKNLFNNSGGKDNLLDNLHSESNSSTISAISNKATYEQSSSGTVILEKPKRSDFANTR